MPPLPKYDDLSQSDNRRDGFDVIDFTSLFSERDFEHDSSGNDA